MVALKLILQTLAGVVAVGGAVGGTVALSNKTATTQTEQTKEETKQTETEPEQRQEQSERSTFLPPQNDERNFQNPLGRTQRTKTEVNLDSTNQTLKAFYLVSAAVDIADTKPLIDLFNGQNSANKNYQCINNSQGENRSETITKDSSCILYSLKNTTNTSLKTSQIQTWTQSKSSDLATKVIKKTDIKNKKFFLLEANENLIKSWTTNKKGLIYLTTKNITDYFAQSNVYVMLKVHAKIATNEVIATTNTIIAQATNEEKNVTTSPNALSPTYKCSFKTNATQTNCKLSKLTSYTPGNSFNFANQAIKNRSETTNIEKNSYYLIESAGIEAHEEKDLKNTKVTYVETQSQNSTSATLTTKTFVFTKLNNNYTRLTELIILDQ